MARIELVNLKKTYGHIVAVRDLSCIIEDGEFIVFVGPSGCGKTTTLRLIAGFEEPDQGEIRIDGKVVNDLEPRDRGLGMVFQTHALFPHKTVAQNIEFGLRMKKVPRDERTRRVQEVAKMVRLTGLLDKFPGACSGGESQRIALARTLVTNPSTFLLDEPLSSLDAKLRRELRAECDRLHEELKKTFIFVTHDQEEALTMSDRIAVLSEGEVQQVGRPEDIYERPRNRFVADFIGETNFIEGTVTRVEDGLAWFAGPAGHPLPAQPCSDVRVGANVALSVRPERLHLVPASTDNALPCRIEAQIYLGTDLQYQVSLSDGSRLTVRTPNCVDQSKRFAVGSQAGLLFDQGSASVLHD